MTTSSNVSILCIVIIDSFVKTLKAKKGSWVRLKGTQRFLMDSLIGDRFLKQFFGSRLHQRRVKPDSQAMTLPANETDKPDEPGNTTNGLVPVTDATLENEQTGEVNQLAVPENGSDQPTTEE
jgi:hypothetical protein